MNESRRTSASTEILIAKNRGEEEIYRRDAPLSLLINTIDLRSVTLGVDKSCRYVGRFRRQGDRGAIEYDGIEYPTCVRK